MQKMKNTLKCFENTSVKVLEDRKLNKNNKSGVRGVSFNKFKNKWCANIKVQRKNIYLGSYNTKEEAIEARKEGEKKYFKPIIDRYYNQGSDINRKI